MFPASQPATAEERLRLFYVTLSEAWGAQHWWPARTQFEVIVGAYLTQNTSWRNVELARDRLREAGALSVKGIRRVSPRKLEQLIRSSGYFRQKATYLKTFVAFLDRKYGGSLARMFAQFTPRLREELLALRGVGPETADSILLYAGQHPVFVVDAYTRRVLERHGVVAAGSTYQNIRSLCERSLIDCVTLKPQAPAHATDFHRLRDTSHSPSRMSRARRTPLAQIFNEMHALIVGVGKHYCLKSKPQCDGCPLQPFLPPVK